MLYSKIITVCSEIHTKHINLLFGLNVELLSVKQAVHIETTGGTYSDHCAVHIMTTGGTYIDHCAVHIVTSVRYI